MNKKDLSLYLICLTELEKIDTKLFEFYGDSSDLFNHKIGVYKIFRKIVVNCRFVYDTSEISSQQIVMSLARMIIDHYSILFLLSSYSTRKEQGLRYCLYLMDSLSNRINTIANFADNVSGLASKELGENIRSNSHDKDAIEYLKQMIVKEQLDVSIEDSVIKNYNWKFVTNYPSKNKRYYNWKELYNMAKIPSHYSDTVQTHFSAFTHGLGTAIIYADDKPKTTLHTYEFIAIVQSLMGKVMLINYPEELKDLELRSDFVELGEEGWNNWK